ncbi:unnamed protein product, partial [Nesidiocoris tenuis]
MDGDPSASTEGNGRNVRQNMLTIFRDHISQILEEGESRVDEAVRSVHSDIEKCRNEAEKRLLDCKKFYENRLLQALTDFSEPADTADHTPPNVASPLQADEDKETVHHEAESKRSWMRERSVIKPVARPKFQKGDNKLTELTEFSLWKHRVRFELLSQDCLFLVDKSVQPTETYDEKAQSQMKSAVMAYLLSNLEQRHQRHVKYATDPAELMSYLERICEPVTMTSEHVLRTRFGSLIYDPRKQTVLEFIVIFDDIVEKIRRCPEAQLSDSQIRYNLLTAFSDALPDLVGSIKREQRPGRSVQEIKELLLMEEDNLREVYRRIEFPTDPDPSGSAMYGGGKNRKRSFNGQMIATEKRADQSKIQCRKCGALGHKADACRRPGRLCFNCGKCGHMSADCTEEPTESTKRYRARHAKVTPAQARLDKWQKSKENQRGPSQKPGQRKKRLPLKKAIAESKRRMKDGKSFMAIFVDPETEHLSEEKRMCWVETSDSEGSNDRAMFARESRENDSGAALSAVERKPTNDTSLDMVIDSGSTEHLVNNVKLFVNLRTLAKPKLITCANKNREADLVIRQAGDIIVYNDETNSYGCLQDVLYAPDLTENLFSLRKQMKNGLNAIFSDTSVELRDRFNGELVKSGQYDGTFWWIHFSLPLANVAAEERARLTETVLSEMGMSYLAEPAIAGPSTSGGEASSLDTCSSIVPLGGREKSAKQQSEYENEPKRAKIGPNSSSHYDTTRTDQNVAGPSSLRDDLGLLWHLRLNHASKSYLEKAAKCIQSLKNVKFNNNILDCSSCKMAKAKRKPCNDVRIRSEIPFHRMWSDLMGPIKPNAYRTQNKYVVSFTDDASRYAMAYEIPDKTKVHQALVKCLDEIRVLKGPECKLVQILTDGGTEYKTLEMRALLSRENITLTSCEPATPQHNGCSERLNLTLASNIRVNLISAGMPNHFWGFALRHSIHVHNRTPNASNNFASPYEILHNKSPNLNYVRRFGCESYVLDNHVKSKSKFAPRANLAFLLECTESGYVLLDANKKTVVRSKHVDFVESKVYGDHQIEPFSSSDVFEIESESVSSENDVRDQEGDSILGITANENMPIETRPPNRDERSAIQIGGTSEFDFFEELEDELDDEMALLTFANGAGNKENPVTYQDALNSSDSQLWIDAMNTEFDALVRCGTWDITPKNELPPNTKIMKSRWVHKIKSEANGKTRYRSRL